MLAARRIAALGAKHARESPVASPRRTTDVSSHQTCRVPRFRSAALERGRCARMRGAKASLFVCPLMDAGRTSAFLTAPL